MAQETSESPSGAGALSSVESESEDKSAMTGVVKTETAAAEDLVLRAELVKETGESPGGPRALAPVEFESGQVGDHRGCGDEVGRRRGNGAGGWDGQGNGRSSGWRLGFGFG